MSRTAPLLLALLAAGCSSKPPIGVRPASEQEAREELERSALTGDEPSATTAWILRMFEAEEAFEEDPVAVLRDLHALLVKAGTRKSAFAMAELAYLAARRLDDRDLYLAAAVYAHEYLLGEGDDPPSPWDRRFRWACDLYNRGVARAFHAPEGDGLLLEAGTRDLICGTAEVEVDTTDFPFPVNGLELRVADELSVVGLGYRVRDSGLGAPLIAIVRQRGEGTAGVGVQDLTRVPATAFLDVEGSLDVPSPDLHLRLSLHSTYDEARVESRGVLVPLEADLSATLAADIESKNLWRFDIRGFFHGADGGKKNGLILLRPFESGRIPVVLVHGTASNPAYWADLINALTADVELRGRYQFWLFIYSTGNPIAFSAATLREQLTELVQSRDPEGTDEALRRMVVIGHSQGGLLTKMTAVHLSAERLAERLGTSLAELDLSPEDEALVRRLYDVEPLPFVERLVFVATPHRGSFLAGKWYARLASSMVSVPGEIVDTSQRVFGRLAKEKDLPAGLQPHVSTSLDNMRPDNAVLQLLADAPIDPRIHYHSIIPIGDADEPEGADDGVVKYESAHLDGADSEVLVPSKHSCQSHPRTIIEVRRILRLHAGLDAPILRPVGHRQEREPEPAAVAPAGGRR